MRILTILGLVLLAGTVQAEDKSSGCGLGWKVTSRNSIVSSYVRAITNASTSSTSGMTSGTSGCDNHSIVKTEKQDIHYAEANFHSLMTEMAKGQGPYLKGFAIVMGCQGAQVDSFSSLTQKNYNQIFPMNGTNPSEMLEATKQALSSEGICHQSI